jgi:hypothetical protein
VSEGVFDGACKGPVAGVSEGVFKGVCTGPIVSVLEGSAGSFFGSFLVDFFAGVFAGLAEDERRRGVTIDDPGPVRGRQRAHVPPSRC